MYEFSSVLGMSAASIPNIAVCFRGCIESTMFHAHEVFIFVMYNFRLPAGNTVILYVCLRRNMECIYVSIMYDDATAIGKLNVKLFLCLNNYHTMNANPAFN
jgi:hypothetical protein